VAAAISWAAGDETLTSRIYNVEETTLMRSHTGFTEPISLREGLAEPLLGMSQSTFRNKPGGFDYQSEDQVLALLSA
jgi:hypothetical protein